MTMPAADEDELRREQIEKLLREAYVYQMRNDLLRAEERCRQLLELDASNAEALELLGRNADAVAAYEKALSINPDIPTLAERIQSLRHRDTAGNQR